MLKKLKHYTLWEILRQIPYKIGYRLALRKEKSRVTNMDWKEVFPFKTLNFEDFSEFYRRCNDDEDEVIAVAQNILNGEIEIFHKKYHFDHKNDWLLDPVSRNEWDRNIFFVSAPNNQAGCKDVKYVLEVNKMNHLVNVAQAFYVTGEEKYIDYIEESILAWKEIVKPGRSIASRIIMDLGFRVINLFYIILLCSPKSEDFNKKVLPHILGIISEHVRRIEKFSSPRWFKSGNGVNHNTGEMIGLIIGQKILESYGIKSYTKSYPSEYRYLIEVLDRTIAPSGAYLEQSANYARVVSEFLVCFDMFMGVFGHPTCAKRYLEGNYTSRLLTFLYDLNYHDFLPNYGDNDDARVLIPFCKKNNEVEYVLEGVNPPSKYRSYIDGSQWIWHSYDSNDVFITTRVGRFTYLREGAGVHAHNDILAVCVGIKGYPLFVDKGCRYYNSGLDIMREDRSVESHNTVSFKGVEMNHMYSSIYYEYPKSRCYKEVSNDGTIFKGVVEYYGRQHIREINYAEGTLLIVDNIKSLNTDKASIRYMLHHDVNPQVINDNTVDLYVGSQKYKIATIIFEGVQDVKIVPTNYSTSYSVEIPTKSIVASINETRTTTKIFLYDKKN